MHFQWTIYYLYLIYLSGVQLQNCCFSDKHVLSIALHNSDRLEYTTYKYTYYKYKYFKQTNYILQNPFYFLDNLFIRVGVLKV